MTEDPRLAAVFARIDAENAEDPTAIEVDGVVRPYAQVYGERMTRCLGQLVADASPALRIAVRGQHVRRFDVARATYPMDKLGYFAWRNALKRHHAEVLACLMSETGWDAAAIDRVGCLVRKERIKQDAEAQTVEDCAALVFLEWDFAGFGETWADDKIVGILAKTWTKMSQAGHARALDLLPALPERLQRLTVQAVRGV